MDFLPATTYNAPPRLGRGRPLKTIVETEELNFGLRSDSETDDSDRTIIARPAGLDMKLAAAARSKLSYSNHAVSPVVSSPCSSNDDMPQRNSVRSSYSESDACTVFSEESCPSLTGSQDSFPTTFHTNSSRSSIASSQSGHSSRNKYPAIMIPRDSWNSVEGPIKEVALGMSPAHKIKLSPRALQSLPQHVPALQAPPSLGDNSSMASNSPCIPALSSAPITPDLGNLEPAQGEAWGTGSPRQILSQHLEIALDEEHSIVLSPREAHSDNERHSLDYSTDWSEMMVHFPAIPGATPVEYTPIEPDMSELRILRNIPSDNGVQLPNDALSVLQHLTRPFTPDRSERSVTTRSRHEMLERAARNTNRTRSLDGVTPTLSDYSFSQLSIPSPGGFFSSLQANSRSTWCMAGSSKMSAGPTSAVAENFYNLPWGSNSTSSDSTIQETTLEVSRADIEDGPPTARQADFVVDDSSHSTSEDTDMYGPAELAASHEYEATYDYEIRKAAEVNVDRTSDWLSAQTSYLSALRETNPLNDPADYPPTPNPLLENENDTQAMLESTAGKAVRFLETATKMTSELDSGTPKSPEGTARESVFLDAFEHISAQKLRQDCFLQAAPRLENINNTRLALPALHVRTLLNQHNSDTIQPHSRPRYRGPFSQNPRQTGNFTKTKEQMLFADAERRQLAMDQILPSIWTTEAQRKILYQGRYTACPAATERLTKKSTVSPDSADSPTKSRMRVLDLGGAATASWGWSVARKHSNVKVYTVQDRTQSQLSNKLPFEQTSASPINLLSDQATAKPTNPSNHRVIVVPSLWQLPFKDNYFDIISARSLYMHLKSRPVPEVDTINEWDLTLKECMRILKPGGILDFFALDSYLATNTSDNRGKHSRESSRDDNKASISPSATTSQSVLSAPLTGKFAQPTTSSTENICADFARDLRRCGYDSDGGSSKLMGRLQKAGFTGIKRQWVGLPIGRTGAVSADSHDEYVEDPAQPSTTGTSTRRPSETRNRASSVSNCHPNGRSRTPFPPAPRPISEVSSISHIINQYGNVEAVQGPVGSTSDIADMSGLLGSMLWEEWLVRLRLEMRYSHLKTAAPEDSEQFDREYECTSLLQGVNETLASGYARGAHWRGVLGWARKPFHDEDKRVARKVARHAAFIDDLRSMVGSAQSTTRAEITVDTAVDRDSGVSRYDQYTGAQAPVGFMTPTTREKEAPMALKLDTRTSPQSRRSREMSPLMFTQSALERGDVGIIPMMIIEE